MIENSTILGCIEKIDLLERLIKEKDKRIEDDNSFIIKANSRNQYLTDVINKQSDRIEQLEQEIRGKYWDKIPTELHLTKQQTKIFSVLLKNKVSSTDKILTAIYSDPGSECVENSIKVQIYHIRKKLDKFGVKVKNKFAIGYFFDEQSRNILRERWGLE